MVTLFGHGIYDLVATTKYSRFHGTSVAWEFVEAPSQMLENWCCTKAQLASLSSHYVTCEKIPASLVDSIIRSKHVNKSIFNLRQLHLAFFDMKMHDIPSPGILDTLEPSIEFNKLRPEVSGLGGPDGSRYDFGNGHTRWGHLMGGYDAGYYGYLE